MAFPGTAFSVRPHKDCPRFGLDIGLLPSDLPLRKGHGMSSGRFSGYGKSIFRDTKNLSQQIKQLERQAYTVEIWRETFLHPEEAVLPERTLVAAPEGLPLAKWMEQKFGIPFYW